MTFNLVERKLVSSYIRVCSIQIIRGKVNILGDRRIGHSEQKYVYLHVFCF
jgi:hypothetical protein